MKILLSGGGTGGHIIPILAVVFELKKLAKESIEFLWIGSKKGPEARFAKRNKIDFHRVFCGKLRRYFSLQNILDIFKVPLGILQAYFIIKKFKPDVLFSKGGYVSVPAVIACWLLRIPSLIHESDSTPGLANRFLSRFVTKIGLGFPEAEKYFEKFKEKIIVLGNPVRPQILFGSKKRGFSYFNLEDDRFVILVTGGSQGAERLNEIIAQAMPRLLEKYQVIHLYGKKQKIDTKKKMMRKYYHPFPFLEAEQMADALACADLIISRAGANILAEIAALAKPSILIPYPLAAQDHQMKNAKIFEKQGAAIVIDQVDLSANRLYQEIKRLFTDKEKLSQMAKSARKLAQPKASEKIAIEILDLIKSKNF